MWSGEQSWISVLLELRSSGSQHQLLALAYEERSHAIAAVRSHRVLGVDSSGYDSNIEVMLGAPVVVRARAERGGGDFVDVRPVRRLLH